MPPPPRQTGNLSMLKSSDSAALADRLSWLYILWERSSFSVRPLPDRVALFEEAEKQWRRDGPVVPPAGDNAGRERLIAECEAICKSTPDNPIAIFTVMFAVNALVVLMKPELLLAPDKGKIMNIVRNRLFEECMRMDPSLTELPGSPRNLANIPISYSRGTVCTPQPVSCVD